MLVALTLTGLLASAPLERVIDNQGMRSSQRYLHDGSTEPMIYGSVRGDPMKDRGLWKLQANGSLAKIELPLNADEGIRDAEGRDGNVWVLTDQHAVLCSQAGAPFVRIALGDPQYPPGLRTGPIEWVAIPRVVPTETGAVVSRAFRRDQNSPSFIDVAVLDLAQVTARTTLTGWPEPPARGEWSLYSTRDGARNRLTWFTRGAFESLDMGLKGNSTPVVRDHEGRIFWRGHGTPERVHDVSGEPITLEHNGTVGDLIPAREGGAWVLVDEKGERWLGRVPGGPWIQVPMPPTRFSNPVLSEPVPGELSALMVNGTTLYALNRSRNAASSP